MITEKGNTAMADKPSVLFVCVHNAGRSQMAAALMNDLSQGSVEVRSAGSEPAARVNPAVVEAMAELGIDIAAGQPRLLTNTDVKAADVVITMGCGDACPYYPGNRYDHWHLEDPAGKGVDAIRPIRDEIQRRVEILLEELVPQNA
jgi:arsenate reductase (thioredoxin)